MFLLFQVRYKQVISQLFISKELITHSNVHCDWAQHYGSTNIPTTRISSDSQNLFFNANENNVWIRNSFCSVHDTTDDGGAISFASESDESKLLIEHSTFLECSSTGYGGAIYFGSSSQCVLSSVCGIKCNADKYQYGQFCYLKVTNSENNYENYKNHIIDSSVAFTELKTTSQFCTMYQGHGDVSCQGVNASNNKVKEMSGIESIKMFDFILIFSK